MIQSTMIASPNKAIPEMIARNNFLMHQKTSYESSLDLPAFQGKSYELPYDVFTQN